MKNGWISRASGLLCLTVLCVWPGGELRAQNARQRQSIQLTQSVLDAYVGEYQLAPRLMLSLRREGHFLVAQLTGQPAIVVYAESETKFFWKVVDAQFTIQKDKGGKVVGLLFEQGAVKAKAKRISSELPKDVELPEPQEILDSPRLIALAKELKVGHREALKKFWDDMQNKAPLVEAIEGNRDASWVTFLWHGNDNTRRVNLTGGPPTLDGDKWLTRLPDTDLWYHTERIQNDARFAYWFNINRPLTLPRADDLVGQVKVMNSCPNRSDPLNPHEIALQGMSVASLLELPSAPSQAWAERVAGVPEGTLKEHKIKSDSLKEERTVTIYTPPDYDPKGEQYGLLILFDGGWYQDNEMVPGPVILDNLIAKEKIRPLVAVFVSQPLQSRSADLSCSESFATFVADELVPWVRKTYHVSTDPKRTIVGGLSLGGLMASYCGLRHSEMFGNVLSQSGAFQWSPGELERDERSLPATEPGWLTGQFVASPRHDVRFYLEAGHYEDGGFGSLLAENRRLRDVLLAKGYPVTWSQFEGAHDFVDWRGSFADGLMTLASAKPSDSSGSKPARSP